MPSPDTPNEYPLELPHPDISAYKEGNIGIPYCFTFEAAAPGPHVMISAVVHGNELCGAIAVDWLLRNKVTPQRGKVTRPPTPTPHVSSMKTSTGSGPMRC